MELDRACPPPWAPRTSRGLTPGPSASSAPPSTTRGTPGTRRSSRSCCRRRTRPVSCSSWPGACRPPAGRPSRRPDPQHRSGQHRPGQHRPGQPRIDGPWLPLPERRTLESHPREPRSDPMPRTPPDITVPDLTGRRAVVTGASDGVGLGIAARLAAAGAEVVLPVRNPRKGEAALAAIAGRTPGADVSLRDPRPVLARLGRRPRRDAARGGPADPHPDQQRRRHDPAGPPEHRRRVRAAVRHQPPRPRRPGGPPDAVAACRPGPRDLADQRRRPLRRDQLAGPELGALLRRDARLQPVEDRVRALRPRARPAQPGERLGHHQQHVAPGSRADEPALRPQRGRPRPPHRGRRVIGALSARGILVGTAESAGLPALYAATSPEARGGRSTGRAGPGTSAARPRSRSSTRPCAAPRRPSVSGRSPRSWRGWA